MPVTAVEEIESAESQLAADALARFRAWFEEFEAARFDRRTERDMRENKVDQLADVALADRRARRAKEL